jgi:response regulator RpfG family c-di-GMP phosphodiesterase
MTERTLLLVDDEENILRALTRLLRRDGYRILTAAGGEEALTLLEQNPGVGVILSDQRMPTMCGSEFLRVAKERFPDTVRLILSGYTELKSVTDAINEGAIYKFLTKPWDDELLRANIREAFQRYDLSADNLRLSIELARANEALSQRVADQSQTLDINQRVLEVSREILEHLPVGVIGLAEDGLVAVANNRMHEFLGLSPGALIGSAAAITLPPELRALVTGVSGDATHHGVTVKERPYTAYFAHLGELSSARGYMLVLAPEAAA